MEGLIEFVNSYFNSGSGYGSGDGSGNGSGCGDGSGYGYRSGSGYSDGSGAGSGSGPGSGAGSGSGDGDDDGYGSGDDDGYGSGSGDGVKYINGLHVTNIDRTPTVIAHIKGEVAKGFILQNDLTLDSCYVVKRDGLFAHGKTIKEAVKSVEEKILNNLPVQDKIDLFKKEFKDFNKKYPAEKFFDWHNKLTGSCLQGRETFCQSKGINIKQDKYTVYEFVEITKNSYNGNIIRMIVDSSQI